MKNKKYFYSNVPEGEKRTTTITMVVKDGSSWAFTHPLSAKQIERFEKEIVRAANELEKEQKE